MACGKRMAQCCLLRKNCDVFANHVYALCAPVHSYSGTQNPIFFSLARTPGAISAKLLSNSAAVAAELHRRAKTAATARACAAVNMLDDTAPAASRMPTRLVSRTEQSAPALPSSSTHTRRCTFRRVCAALAATSGPWLARKARCQQARRRSSVASVSASLAGPGGSAASIMACKGSSAWRLQAYAPLPYATVHVAACKSQPPFRKTATGSGGCGKGGSAASTFCECKG